METILENMWLPEGTILKSSLGNPITILKPFRQGGFALTYIAEMTVGRGRYNQTKEQVIVKEFFPRKYCRRDNGTDVVFDDRKIDVKVLEMLQEKFKAETDRIAEHSTLYKHPNIVDVIDRFECNGTRYCVLEYLTGGTINDIVQEGKHPLPFETAIQYTLQICEALKECHKLHIMHNDISPTNIVLNGEGVAKLIDFGANKTFNEVGLENTIHDKMHNCNFASPELLRGLHHFVPASDVYSLAATLYFMLTGKLYSPVTGIEWDDTEFREILHKALRQEISDRYQTVEEFRMAIQMYQNAKERVKYVQDINVLQGEVDHLHAEIQELKDNPNNSLEIQKLNEQINYLLSTRDNLEDKMYKQQTDYEQKLSESINSLSQTREILHNCEKRNKLLQKINRQLEKEKDMRMDKAKVVSTLNRFLKSIYVLDLIWGMWIVTGLALVSRIFKNIIPSSYLEAMLELFLPIGITIQLVYITILTKLMKSKPLKGRLPIQGYLIALAIGGLGGLFACVLISFFSNSWDPWMHLINLRFNSYLIEWIGIYGILSVTIGYGMSRIFIYNMLNKRLETKDDFIEDPGGEIPDHGELCLLVDNRD